MPKIRNFSSEEECDIVAQYEDDGLTIAEISRLHKCSAAPVQRVLRDHEIPKRSQGDELKKTRNQKVIRLHETGKSMDAISDTFGITRQRVHQIITRGY